MTLAVDQSPVNHYPANLETTYTRGPIRPLLGTLTQFMWIERDGINPVLFVAKVRTVRNEGGMLEQYAIDGHEVSLSEPTLAESILENIMNRWALARESGLGWKPVVLEMIR
jgi:hypothetical protein